VPTHRKQSQGAVLTPGRNNRLCFVLLKKNATNPGGLTEPRTMTRKIAKKITAISMAATLLALTTACKTTDQGTQTAEASPTKAAPAPTYTPPAPTYSSASLSQLVREASDRGMNYSWQGFPSNASTPADAAILVEKLVPKEVRPNQDYTVEITVSNRARYGADKVIITESLPPNFKLTKATPTPEVRSGVLRWDLGNMGPNQRETLSITGNVTKAGSARHSNNADIEFNLNPAAGIVAIIEPLFEFNINAPDKVVISDNIPVRLEFRNIGSAPVNDAKLIHTLPKGLLTADGRSKIEMNIGDLKPGQTRAFDMSLKAETVGKYQTQMTARARDNISANASFNTSVQKPQLSIVAKSPSKRFVGNIIPYEITVKNVGDAPARDLAVSQVLAEGTSLASANEGGTAKGTTVEWNLGTLQPGESKTVSSRVLGKQIMTARSVAYASALAAEQVEGVMITDIDGIAAILLEVGDINDPVPVGDVETYEIKAMNQGSLAATGLVVTCTLEEGMEFVKTTGATKSSHQGDKVIFEPLPALAPQSEALWRVVVKARKAGDTRFQVSVQSDQLDRPVVENEATHFYE